MSNQKDNWPSNKLPELPSFDALRRSSGPNSKGSNEPSKESLTMVQGFKSYLKSMAKVYNGKDGPSTPSNTSSQAAVSNKNILLQPPVGIEITGVSTEDVRGFDPLSESLPMQSSSNESMKDLKENASQNSNEPKRAVGDSEDLMDSSGYMMPLMASGRPRAKSLDPNGAYQIPAQVGIGAQKNTGSSDSRGLLKVHLTSMPSGFMSPEASEEAEARDQVSELKLNSSVLASTILMSSLSSEDARILASNATVNDSLNSSYNAGSSGPFVKTSKMFSGYSKKTTTSAPTTPGISLLTLTSMTKKSSPVSLSVEPSTTTEPNLPKKYQPPRGALSAHEIHPPPLPSIDSAKTYSLNDFHVIRRVGKGGFAKVFLVRHRRAARKYYALKCIKKSDIIRLKQEKQILNEKNILKQFKHPFIVDLFHAFQTRTHLFMTLEFVPGGDLYSLMKITKVFLVILGLKNIVNCVLNLGISRRASQVLHCRGYDSFGLSPQHQYCVPRFEARGNSYFSNIYAIANERR